MNVLVISSISVIPLPSLICMKASSITRRLRWYYSMTRTFSLLLAIIFFNLCLRRFWVSIVSKFSFLLAFNISCFGFSSSAFFCTISNCLQIKIQMSQIYELNCNSPLFFVVAFLFFLYLLHVRPFFFFIFVSEHDNFILNLIRLVNFFFICFNDSMCSLWGLFNFITKFPTHIEMQDTLHSEGVYMFFEFLIFCLGFVMLCLGLFYLRT